MHGLDFLNLVIGLIFIYLIYSIAASTIWEMIINLMHLRGRMLLNWLVNNFNELSILEGKKKQSKILDHPLIKGMLKKQGRRISYISSVIFVDVLIDLVVNEDVKNSDDQINIADINLLKDNLKKTHLLSKGLRSVFLQYISEASGNLQQVKEKIGKWFDEAQERLIDLYKRNLQKWIFVISLVLVGVTNADTIKLANYLYSNPSASEALANKASLFMQDSAIWRVISNTDTTLFDSVARQEQKAIANTINKNLATLKDLNEEIKSIEIPIGWSKEDLKSLSFCEFNFYGFIKKIGGLLLTILAVSVGSPFWFDILSKLANLRSSGNKPKSLLEEKPEKNQVIKKVNIQDTE
jgi:hypothetical protein